jgi:hypothetical protein
VVEPNETVIQHHCARCGRDFVTDTSSNTDLAVFVSVVSFYQLNDEVTTRWLRDVCPGMRLSSDEEDRRKRIAQFKVVNDERFEVGMPQRRRYARTPRPNEGVRR